MATPKPASSSLAWYSWMSMVAISSRGSESRSGLLDGLVHVNDVLRHPRGGGVDHPPVELRRAAPVPRGLVERDQDALGPIHLGRRRTEHLVGQRDLRGMDGPLALDAKRRGALRGEPIAIR